MLDIPPKKFFAFFLIIFLIGTITIEGSFRTSHKYEYDEYKCKHYGKVLELEKFEEDSPVSVTADLDLSSSSKNNKIKSVPNLNISDKNIEENSNYDLIFNMDIESESGSNLNEILINDRQMINIGINDEDWFRWKLNYDQLFASSNENNSLKISKDSSKLSNTVNSQESRTINSLSTLSTSTNGINFTTQITTSSSAPISVPEPRYKFINGKKWIKVPKYDYYNEINYGGFPGSQSNPFSDDEDSVFEEASLSASEFESEDEEKLDGSTNEFYFGFDFDKDQDNESDVISMITKNLFNSEKSFDDSTNNDDTNGKSCFENLI